MTTNGNSKSGTALVLSGGGAYGAYEVGVVKALYGGQSPATSRAPLDPDVFVGTSVGSFNAAVLAMNKGGAQASQNHLHDIWINSVADNANGRGNGVYRVRGDLDGYLDPRIPGGIAEQFRRMFNDTRTFGGFAVRGAKKILTGEGRPLHRTASLLDISLFLDISPFKKLLHDFVEPRALRESPKILSVAATNWSTGLAEPYDLAPLAEPDEQAWSALQASAAIPCLFPPVWMLNNFFIDGGVVMNTPIKPAIDNGASELHVVSLDANIADLSGKYSDNTWDAFNRVYMAMVATNIAADIAMAKAVNEGISVVERAAAGMEIDAADGKRFLHTADLIFRKLRATKMLPRKITIHRYYPKKPLGGLLGMLNFDRSVIDAMIEQGYRDACEHECVDKRTGKNICVIPREAPVALSTAAGS